MTLPLATTGKEDERYDGVRTLAHVSKIVFPNDKILPIVLRADNSMEVATNKYTWAETDADWELALKISNYYAAIEIVDGLPNEDSAPLWEALNKLISQINRTDAAATSSTLAVAKSINISNELDASNYIPEQDTWG